MTEPVVFLRGQMVPASQAHLAIYDAGIVLGATVTEMTRTFRHQPFRLEDHVARLFRALKYTRMNIGMTPEELCAVSRQVIEHNAGLIQSDDELGLIHFVTPGEYATYAGSAAAPGATKPTLCIHTFVMPFELWSAKLTHGAHLVTPSIRHVPPQCYDPKMKYRSRMHYYLADQEARQVDPQATALLLDLDGNLTETSGANFLLVENGTVVTPTTRNTLPGISRQTTREICDTLGIPFVERDVQLFHLMNADEAWLSSTPFCLLPATKINGVPIGSGQPGPLLQRIMSEWSRRVGFDIHAQIHAGAARRTAGQAQ